MKSGHTRRQWEYKFFECGCRCTYCEEPLTLDRATKDHIIPISRGGSDQIANIVPACFRCNTLKNNRTLEEFLKQRPAFSATVERSTAIGKPIQQARALLYVGCTVEKAKAAPRDEPEPITKSRVMPLERRDEIPLHRLRKESESISWAWRHPA